MPWIFPSSEDGDTLPSGAKPANFVYAGPASGAAASPTFRLLVLTDVASILSGVYQPLDADLTDIAALATTAFGRALLTLAGAAAARSTLGSTTIGDALFIAANAAAARSTLGLVIGSNVQAYSANLTTWAGLAPSANGQSFVSAADYAAMRTLLGVGSGGSGGAIFVVANAAARWALTAPTVRVGDIVEQADTGHRWLACDLAALAGDAGWQDLGEAPPSLLYTAAAGESAPGGWTSSHPLTYTAAQVFAPKRLTSFDASNLGVGGTFDFTPFAATLTSIDLRGDVGASGEVILAQVNALGTIGTLLYTYFTNRTSVDAIITNGGTGYGVGEALFFNSSAGSGAAAFISAVGDSGEITGITFTSRGSGYSGVTVTVVSSSGSGASLDAALVNSDELELNARGWDTTP